MILLYAELFFLGLFAGCLGTILGLGGGIILVPALLLLFPGERPELITCISLAVIFINACSGTVAYTRVRRVDYRSGLLFAGASVPFSALGVFAVHHVEPQPFRLTFGIVMMLSALFLFFGEAGSTMSEESLGEAAGRKLWCVRDFTDALGVRFRYAFFAPLAVVSGFIGGFLSSFLGIGGGLVHVPVMYRVLRFPIHVVTATSHFILIFTAAAGLLTHYASGTFTAGYRRALAAGLGALVGAQLGAVLSRRLRGPVIAAVFAVLLFVVGLRLALF